MVLNIVGFRNNWRYYNIRVVLLRSTSPDCVRLRLDFGCCATSRRLATERQPTPISYRLYTFPAIFLT